MELTAALADEIAKVSAEQLRTSRQYKAPRLKDIRESENLYLGIVPKSLRNPFNESFPYVPGFVDTIVSETDEPPHVTFSPQEEADLKSALKYTAAFEVFASSTAPNAKLALKDRHAKKLAAFGGRGIYSFFAESDPEFKATFAVKDYYEFHCEPNGGGLLEDHLFCGEDSVFKTDEELRKGAEEGFYDRDQVAKVLTGTNANEYKENEDAHEDRNNRHRALGFDVGSNNYTGQKLYRFAQWFTTYRGERWYCLFDISTGMWIRVKPLKEVFKSGLYPYVSWATHEDPRVFWSKAPCDDARPIARTINRLLNQELYNREKRNHGQRLYDPDMIMDLEALTDSRPDGVVPVKVGPGKNINLAAIPVKVGEISGTIDLVGFLDSFSGQKLGVTPSSQGQSEPNKKVGIFFGEMQQIRRRFGVMNRSYREAYAELGTRFIHGLDEHLNTDMAIKIMGAGGVEWTTISKADLKTNRDLDIKVEGGSEQQERDEIKAKKKEAALAALTTVNPRWKDEQLLRNAGFDDEDIKHAFDETTSANRVLLSEAAQAEQDIVRGREPKLNRGANAAFMQHIIDFATDLTLDDKEKENRIAVALMDYAMAHVELAAENEARSAMELVRQRSAASAALPGAIPEPVGAGPMKPVPPMPAAPPELGGGEMPMM
jgi:hypothetical protein